MEVKTNRTSFFAEIVTVTERRQTIRQHNKLKKIVCLLLFWLWAYPMKVIQETHRVHDIYDFMVSETCVKMESEAIGQIMKWWEWRLQHNGRQLHWLVSTCDQNYNHIYQKLCCMFVPRLFLYLTIMSYGWPCLNDGYNWSSDLLRNIIVMTTSVSRRLNIFCIKLKIMIWRFYSAAVHLVIREGCHFTRVYYMIASFH